MMKFLQAIGRIVVLLALSSSAYAQVDVIGSSEYGRIFDLVYDQTVPNRVYAGSMANHLLVSNDNAETWEIFYTFEDGYVDEIRTVSDTHISFVLENAADQERNTVYLMEVATKTVTPIQRPFNPLATKSWVADYSFYPTNTDIMVYDERWQQGFSNFETVHYTTDGGQTWNAIYNNWEHDSVFLHQVLLNPGNPDFVYLSRGNGPTAVDGGLYVTKNAGETWNEFFPGQLLEAISVDPSDTERVLIGQSKSEFGNSDPVAIYESLDGGISWGEILIPFDNFYRKIVLDIAFNPYDNDHIVILETNEIAVSRDGGQTWTVNIFDRYNPEEYYYGWQTSFNPENPEELIITSNWYPQRSLDGGLTAERMKSPFFISEWVAMSPEDQGINPGAPHLYYGVQYGMVKKNLETQEEVEHDILRVDWVTNGGVPRYFFDQNQYGKIAKFKGGFPDRLSISRDNGETFFDIMGTWFDKFTSAAFDPNDNDKIWLAYEREGVVVVDYSVENPNPWNVEKTYITLPDQGDWFAGDVLSIWLNPTYSNEVLIGRGGRILSSGDGGQSWEDSSDGLTLDRSGGRIWQITQNPHNTDEIYLSTDQGVFLSTYRYQDWENILPVINAQQVAFDPNNEDVIVAAVYSSQVTEAQIIYSTDGGETWTYIPTEAIEHVGSGSMAFDFNENGFRAYIATSGLGVITYDVSYEVLGTQDLSDVEENSFAIYPNPVSDRMNIALADGAQVEEVSIFNLLGAEVKRASGVSQLNLSDLQTGIYLVRVLDNQGNRMVQKIIKN